MLNGLIIRLALAASALWVLLCVVIVAFTDANLPQSLLIVSLMGILPSAALVSLALLLRWVLGPIGRWGDEKQRYGYYEILDD